VRAQSEASLVTFGPWTLRVRPAAAFPARLLLLIHGRTGDENSMWVFVRQFAAAYSVVAPRAPHAAGPAGHSWVEPDSQLHAPIRLEDLEASADALIALVDDYAAAHSLSPDRFDMIGFSEGAALTITLALMHPERIGRMGVLAGFAPAGAERFVTTPVLQGKPVFVAHGTQDRLVPIESSRESVRLLQHLGARVVVCEAEIGHKVSAACLHGLQSFFA
jgi:phospholipase/carboxylesterase